MDTYMSRIGVINKNFLRKGLDETGPLEKFRNFTSDSLICANESVIEVTEYSSEEEVLTFKVKTSSTTFVVTIPRDWTFEGIKCTCETPQVKQRPCTHLMACFRDCSRTKKPDRLPAPAVYTNKAMLVALGDVSNSTSKRKHLK